MTLPSIIGTGSIPIAGLIGSDGYHPGLTPNAEVLKNAWMQAVHWAQFGSVHLFDQSYSIRPSTFSGGELRPHGPNEPDVHFEHGTWVDVGRARCNIPPGFNNIEANLTCKVPTSLPNVSLKVRCLVSSSDGTVDTGQAVSYAVNPIEETRIDDRMQYGRAGVQGVHDTLMLQPIRGTINVRCSVPIVSRSIELMRDEGSAGATTIPQVVIQAFAVSERSGSQIAARVVPINARAWATVTYQTGSGKSSYQLMEPLLGGDAGAAYFESSSFASSSLTAKAFEANDFTVSTWMRLPHNVGGHVMGIWWDYDAVIPDGPVGNDVSNFWAFTLQSESSSQQGPPVLQFNIGGDGHKYAELTDSAARLNDGQWHHVVMRYHGSGSTNGNKLDIHFDGVSSSLHFPDEAIPAYPMWNSGTHTGINSKMTFGKTQIRLHSGSGGTGAVAPGVFIDDTAFWSRSLSDTEIGQIYNFGIPSDLTGSGEFSSITDDLMAYWVWNDITGTTTSTLDSIRGDSGYVLSGTWITTGGVA